MKFFDDLKSDQKPIVLVVGGYILFMVFMIISAILVQVNQKPVEHQCPNLKIELKQNDY